MKQKLSAIVGSLMSVILGLLGFSSCDQSEPDDPMLLMYGSPYGEFKFSGLVTDEAGAPVEKARIIVRTVSDEKGNYYYTPYGTDTVMTDNKGKYEGKMGTNFPSVRLLCEDPSGQYKPDSTDLQLKYKDGEGWFMGTASSVTNFKLKKADKKEGK
ncbi:MAG: hypothetical protein HDR92_03970 [Bacteroides sp.]|nr:hypothetical protein [Bacteroides sp.]